MLRLCKICQKRHTCNPKAKALALKRRTSKRKNHAMSTKAIREAVLDRSNGWCESPECWGEPAEMDHWLGGWGRRRREQAVETCWMLCRECHADRTNNRPTVWHWNSLFEQHCQKYGYPFQPHIEKQPMARNVRPSNANRVPKEP